MATANCDVQPQFINTLWICLPTHPPTPFLLRIPPSLPPSPVPPRSRSAVAVSRA